MGKFRPPGKLGPTRDWSDQMNLLIMAMVDKGREVADCASELRQLGVEPRAFTHVYKGSIKNAASGIDLGGVSDQSVQRRLQYLGYIEHIGTEKKYQGRAIWLVRNELVSKDDASRADYLSREDHRKEKKPKPKPSVDSKPRYDVREDELYPGKQVVEKPNGPGEYVRMNREIVSLQEDNARLQATAEDWEDEAKKLQEKLDRTNVPELTEKVALLEIMVSQLLAGGEAAEMFRQAVKLAHRSP